MISQPKTGFVSRVKSWVGLTTGSGYDAVDQTGKRRQVSPLLKSEDMTQQQSRKLIASGRDLSRNFSLVAWAVRQHLNYLTEFNFQMRSPDVAINEQVETLMEQWERPANCDVTGRHPLCRLIRMVEQRKIIDGEVFLLKLASGQLQAIEADRVKNPDEVGQDTWINGIKVNPAGRMLAVSIHKRNGSTTSWEKNVASSSIFHHAHFDRFDQVHGISPIAAAINSFKDVYEGIDLALAKLKVEQMFALVFYRDNTDPIGETSGTDDEGYQVDFGKGPIKLDLDPGDKADFLKSDNPGSATQDFLKLVIRIALASLDLPYGFFDSGDTNFFGGKAGWMVYERALLHKIRDLCNLLRQITIWKLQSWIADGLLTLPAGMTVGDLEFEWVHRGMPWWDQSKEIDGDLAAIGAGLSDPYTVCKKRGMGEWEENVLRIARAREFAASLGVPITFDRAGNTPMPDVPQPVPVPPQGAME